MSETASGDRFALGGDAAGGAVVAGAVVGAAVVGGTDDGGAVDGGTVAGGTVAGGEVAGGAVAGGAVAGGGDELLADGTEAFVVGATVRMVDDVVVPLAMLVVVASVVDVLVVVCLSGVVGESAAGAKSVDAGPVTVVGAA